MIDVILAYVIKYRYETFRSLLGNRTVNSYHMAAFFPAGALVNSGKDN